MNDKKVKKLGMRYWQEWLKSWNEDEAFRTITVNGHSYYSQK